MNGPSMSAMSDAAARHGIFLLAGSFAEAVKGSRKMLNTSCFFGPSGKILAAYRKMHLFDVDLPPHRDAGKAKKIRESDYFLRGKKPVLTEASLTKPGIQCGLSICYDLRFPELYRGYALRGAQILFVPSNFTRQTGQEHWEPLLRARAIENQCFVIAPGQSGVGSQGVLSHGTSLILDPWGRILAKGPAAGEAILYANLDLKLLDSVRKTLPSLKEASLS